MGTRQKRLGFGSKNKKNRYIIPLKTPVLLHKSWVQLEEDSFHGHVFSDGLPNNAI